MRPTNDHRYEVGQPVLFNGRTVTIEKRGININKWPVYRVDGTWVLEKELTPPPPI